MIMICAWCEAKKIRTILKNDGIKDGRIGHGICPACMKEQLKKSKITVTKGELEDEFRRDTTN